MRKKREDVTSYFSGVYQHAVRMASAVEVEESRPRIASRQTKRANAPSESIEEHYKRNVAIPFLDHIHSDLVTRFSSEISCYMKYENILLCD